MISAKPTENLAGITIEGDHDDFYEINDVDTTNDGYSTDSVIYVDANGNIIKAPLN